jgi:acyl-coenzyme A synthetase/AMP-(fatty) acid ligase
MPTRSSRSSRSNGISSFCAPPTLYRTLAGGPGGARPVLAAQDHTKQLTAPYEYPREIRYVTELPKTVSGKIRRTELREWLRTQIPEGVERRPV